MKRVIGIVCICMAIPAMGQQNISIEQPKGEKKTSEKVEKLEVTGSYIKRIDIEGPSPVEIIDREEFTRTGSTTIADVLKENASFEGLYESSGHVRFRGQHAGNVLILINGLRMPKSFARGGYYTDISSIPLGIVDRVELLKDGGAALYGSDAMSGVINFITRENVDEGELTLSTTQPEIGVGQRQKYTVSYGKTFTKGNIMGLVEVKQLNQYGELELDSHTNLNKYKTSQVGSSGYYKINGNKQKFGIACETGTCETNPLMYDEVQPESSNVNSMLTGKYEFNNNVEATFLGMFSHRTSREIDGPNAITYRDLRKSGGEDERLRYGDLKNSTLGSKLKQSSADPLSDDDRVEIFELPNGSLGERINDRLEQNWSLQSQLKGDMGETWEWNFQVGYVIENVETTQVSGNADKDAIASKIKTGEYVPGSTNNLNDTRVQPVLRTLGNLTTTKLVTSGEIYDLGRLWSGGGPLSVAIGAEAQWEAFAFDNDIELSEKNYVYTTDPNIDGSRRVNSVFTEFSAIMTEKLEMQLAGRFDDYSDVGQTFNPKLAAAYRANQKTLLRSSVGTGFRAPGLVDLHARGFTGRSEFQDEVLCAKDSNRCYRDYYNVNNYSNPDIKPETSLHYSAGLAVQPTKQLSMSLDQWNFEGKGTVSKVYPSDITDLERKYGTSALDSIGARAERNANGELILLEYPQLANMGERILRGVDANVSWKQPIRVFDMPMGLTVSSSQSHIYERKTRFFELDSLEGTEDYWKNNTGVSLDVYRHYYRLGARSVSKNSVSSSNPNSEMLPRHTEFDVTYAYKAPWKGSISLTVKNITNDLPPVAQDGAIVRNGNLSRQYSVFSPLGRQYYVNYSQTF